MKKRSVKRSSTKRRRVDAAQGMRAPLGMPADKPRRELEQLFQVLVECADEASQRALFERLTSEGHRCRALVL